MTVSVLNSANNGDERPPHDAAILLGVIKQLSQLLESNSMALGGIETWLHTLCKEQTIGECF